MPRLFLVIFIGLVGGLAASVTSVGRAQAHGDSPGSPLSFEHANSGGPIGWDTCRRHPVVINPKHANYKLFRHVLSQIRYISRVSQVSLYYAGTTNTRQFRKYRGGDLRLRPIVVRFENARTYAPLRGPVVGQGGSSWVSDRRGREQLVRGRIVFDTQLTRASAKRRVGVIRHEFSHVLGLGHSRHRYHLMSPILRVHDFGPVERAAFATLAAQPCPTRPQGAPMKQRLTVVPEWVARRR